MKYIDAEKLIAEIERLKESVSIGLSEYDMGEENGKAEICNAMLSFITSLQQEQPDVDLDKLGGIARHLIAVKDHEEDMRLNEGEWLLLERIGYPERFNARKEE